MELSLLRDPRDLEFLLDRLREDEVQDVAQDCVEREWGRSAQPALVARLVSCDDDCLCLIEALEHVGDASALEPLASKLGGDDESTAQWAADAIAVIARREGQIARAVGLLEQGRSVSRSPHTTARIDGWLRDLRAAS